MVRHRTVVHFQLTHGFFVQYGDPSIIVSSPLRIFIRATFSDKGASDPQINNAGIARGNTILNTTSTEFLLTYKVNVLGPHNILREFLPHLIKTNHGHVMTTASSASYASIPQLSEYSCSKSAVLALHETLNGELVHRYAPFLLRMLTRC